MADRTNNSTTRANIKEGSKTVAATGTPEAIKAISASNSDCQFESVELTARISRSTANTGNIWIGGTSTNSSQLRQLIPGERLVLSAPAGKKIDLRYVYVDVETNGDGVLWIGLN